MTRDTLAVLPTVSPTPIPVHRRQGLDKCSFEGIKPLGALPSNYWLQEQGPGTVVIKASYNFYGNQIKSIVSLTPSTMADKKKYPICDFDGISIFASRSAGWAI